MSNEVEVAKEYFNMASQNIMTILKMLQNLLDQKAIALDKEMEGNILKYIKEFAEFNDNYGSEMMSVAGLSYNDTQLIKTYIDNETSKNNEFSMPVLCVPQMMLDGSLDKDNAQYMLLINQKDVQKLVDMLKFFENEGIKTDGIHLEDISIVNNPNNLFNAEGVECNEIEFPLADEQIYNNVKTMLLSKGIEFNVAPHDNSVSIIYKRDDQKKILNILYDKNNENAQVLWGTNDIDKIKHYKELFIAKNDKALNDRDSQKEMLFDNNGR